uniref:NAD(P)H-quinone oxidoreductase subunit 4L, chloroplastic n=1 Tax=Streptosarcina moshanensis TaxID=3096259 RepID=A0AAU7VA72_9VIRI|nr:subunit 4L of NADH-plastoquinone oxidoreductase [Streptosarcina arenaria]YP_010933541.1 subunit 4L of NADH-plastoquinone oxidoreductase [Streptosarcina costaricana]WKT08870.1 subunit 4L of NADH-plastoquinone oxidoreductase [Streptosarcina arenaria]WKT08972.1 subunit 4L of NADH-plastoquinone oxidoreductase [Streptosarcina costaricana]
MIQQFLALAACVFCIGIYGLLTTNNLVRALMCLELLFNAVNINLIAFSNFVDSQDAKGQVFALFVIALAAAEAAVGLAILLAIYRTKGSVRMDGLNLLKW